ncbi:MAG: bifunctional hydroxymethylpyrimidine kinase/phosphomethylpyrimidine kinase [Planctomycetaceae bacterium]|nr:bifunctional hydroxymethylpyrimidine kinase/phosphomethylpyrimidine kinase [Planctomycetaceae bacterium]
MNRERFEQITGQYGERKIAIVGDFCLDRYLEIDPARAETSIETGLPVHNVVRVRSQPGAAGTILNNVAALGVGEIFPVGFCGEDGEGFELKRALSALPSVNLEHFVTTPQRRTFVYCKPLVMEPGQLPRELNRLDSKNWTETPAALQQDLAARVAALTDRVDAMILLDQVDIAETGVVTRSVAAAARDAIVRRPQLLVLADSRRGVQHFPPLGFKMNADELAKLSGNAAESVEDVKAAATELAATNGQPVFVTLAENGIVGAAADQPAVHIPTYPVAGPIDIVGAGDATMANLTAALAAGADMTEAMQLAMAAASVVIHQLGTTGTATVPQLARRLSV